MPVATNENPPHVLAEPDLAVAGRALTFCLEEAKLKAADFLESCFGSSLGELTEPDWERFRRWHLATRDNDKLAAVFRRFERQVEESVELYFMDLASATDTYSGDLFNDETHESFYLAARAVNDQGLRTQLDFLRDNAPSVYRKLLQCANLCFVLPSGE